MRPRSIRWQLPLSYAAIALVSVLSLGAVLLVILRSYYIQREYEFLEGNASTVSSAVYQMLDKDTPLGIIRAQIASYSFLSQVRIQLIDANGEVLADSGVPYEHNMLSISAMQQVEPNPAARTEDTTSPFYIHMAPGDYRDLRAFSTSIEMPIGISMGGGTGDGARTEYYTPVITLDFIRISNAGVLIGDTAASETDDDDEFTQTLPATSTLYGFGFSENMGRSGPRSSKFVEQALLDSNGQLLGTIILSDGPAYGRQIVSRVASVWLVAGVLAVLIAAGIGWLISRRITAPLIELTTTTTRMAKGNFSVRSNLTRNDEFGVLAKTFNEMARQVETTVITLRRFVADAAHELHTPLTALHTNLELALDETNWVTRRAYVERARAQLKRLVSLTDGLLDLSRIESGLARTQHKPVALSPLIQEISELHASRSEQAAINFILCLPPEPITVYGNATQLRCALNNLLDNAIKFTPPGQSVTVDVKQINGWVDIQVRDTGIGIPPDEISYIFSRFHRCRNAANSPGNGLGLAIVRGIVDAHKGRIKVRNTYPGTNFTLQLPVTG